MIKRTGFLFDLNGTMVNDMEYHITAWHRIVNALGAHISLRRMKDECYGKNSELLERLFPGRFSDAEKEVMSFEKERAYQQAFTPELKLIEGLPEFLRTAQEKEIFMAIGSAAIRFNIDFVLDGTNIQQYFTAIVSADDVVKSKPHPETFLSCAEQLGVAAEDCIVFEDTPKGVEAACNAGMKAVVVNTLHHPQEFSPYANVTAFVKNYTELEHLFS